jgi:hypothetical protein
MFFVIRCQFALPGEKSMVRSLHVAGLALFLLFSPFVRASSFSFTGTFVHDTDLQYFTFTLLNPTPEVALRTWSYSGGTNAAGQTISSGGFEPYLNLYMADGTQMNPGFSGLVPFHPSATPYPISCRIRLPARAPMFTIPPRNPFPVESGPQVPTPWYFRSSRTLESGICLMDSSPSKCSV